MKRRIQPGAEGWWKLASLRLVAGFCLTLMLVASTAQVCHSHEDVEPGGGGTVSSGLTPAQLNPGAMAGKSDVPARQAPGREAPGRQAPESSVRCPLCVAMHSVLPASATLAQVAVLRVEAMGTPAQDAARPFVWRFELASRPPPAGTERA